MGVAGKRWASIRAVSITQGDLIFENGYRVTEDKGSGLVFLNDEGERIAKPDRKGKLHIRGDIIKDL